MTHLYRDMNSFTASGFHVGYGANGTVAGTGSRDESRPERGVRLLRPCQGAPIARQGIQLSTETAVYCGLAVTFCDLSTFNVFTVQAL